MKDYYRILQLHPLAEQEVVEAAYRRLMKKYHPDMQMFESRNDPTLLKKVQDLNTAYEVLSNPRLRNQYDQSLLVENKTKKHVRKQSVASEERSLFVRCGKTKRTFRLSLSRPKGSKTAFRVQKHELYSSDLPVEDNVNVPSSLFSRLTRKIKVLRDKRIKSVTKILAIKESNQMNLEGSTLSMGEINWAGLKCPDCSSQVRNPNGTFATWVACANCGHIRCVGNIERTKRGVYSKCPWCGAKNKITRSVPVNTKDFLSLKGVFVEGDDNKQTIFLPEKEPPKLANREGDD